jgi:hypothetical protein
MKNRPPALAVHAPLLHHFPRSAIAHRFATIEARTAARPQGEPARWPTTSKQ